MRFLLPLVLLLAACASTATGKPAICDNLPFDKLDLKMFLLNLIKEEPNDPYVNVLSKDWDMNLVRSRATPWAKRLLLLQRVQVFIVNFQKHFSEKMGRKPKTIGDFRNLLRFGITPLYQSEDDMVRAAEILADILDTRSWDRPEYHVRSAVT